MQLNTVQPHSTAQTFHIIYFNKLALRGYHTVMGLNNFSCNERIGNQTNLAAHSVLLPIDEG